MHEQTIAAQQKPSDNSSNSGSRTTESILAERAKTHGDFTVNAQIAQSLKSVIRANLARLEGNGPFKLTCDKAEAIDMILNKISRICAGNPNERDHWDDIAGYAKLAAERCQ